MTAAEIAQLAIVLAPIAERLIVDGSKLVAEYKKNLAPADMEKALELSKSASWPQLDFKAGE